MSKQQCLGLEPQTSSIEQNLNHCTTSTCYMALFNKGFKNPLENDTKNLSYTATILVEIKDYHGNLVPIRALLDTGTDQKLILK